MCPEEKRSPEAQTYINRLTEVGPPIAQACQMSQAFPALVQERRGNAFDTWMTEAMQSGSEAHSLRPGLAGGPRSS